MGWFSKKPKALPDHPDIKELVTELQADDTATPGADKRAQKAQAKQARAAAKAAKKAEKEQQKAAKKAAKGAKSRPIKRFKRRYASEASLANSSPELKAVLLILLVLAVVAGGLYGRFWVLNPQLQENRRLIGQIPQLQQQQQQGLVRIQQLRDQVKVLRHSLDTLLSQVPAEAQVSPRMTEYLYVLQRFQLQCDQFSPSDRQPVQVGNQQIGLTRVAVDYRCKGPFLSYLQALTQLQQLAQQLQIQQESIARGSGQHVDISGRMTFVVNQND